MKNKKIKELWENKKELLKNKNAMMIGGITLVGLIALGSVGYMMATSYKEEVKIENKVVVSNKKNEKDIKESDNKSKEAINKKEDKINKESSTENKVDTEEKKEVASDESKNSTSSNKQIEKNNNNNSSSSSSSSSSNNNNNEVNSVVGNTSQEIAEKPSKPTNINTNTDTNTHTHSWVEQLQTVNHQEQGHYEDVLVSAAWAEQIPVYETQGRAICNGCKADITGDPGAHMKEALLAGNEACAAWTGKYVDIQVGTETINHEAVYDKKHVVDKAAWSDNIVSGYKCSCGATK